MEDRSERILDALAVAEAGDYSAQLEFASNEDDLGRIAGAVNSLLKKMAASRPAAETPADGTSTVRHYRDMLDTFRESYFETDLKGNLVFFTERVLLGLGYEKKEFRSVSFKELMDEANIKKIRKAFGEVFLTGQPIHGFDCELLKKNNEKIDVEFSISLIGDETGTPIGFRSVVRDVTKRRQAERALRQSEENYRNILETMGEIYIEIDLKGHYIFFNDALCRMLGYSRDELQNINYRMINPPEDYSIIFRDFNEVFRTGIKREYIHRVLCKDGSIKTCELSIALLRSPGGAPSTFAVIGRDISEKIRADLKLRESERHLRLITDNIRDIIWTMNFNLELTYMSPSAFRITGYSPQEVIAMPVDVILPTAMYEQVKNFLHEELAKDAAGHASTGRVISTFEVPLTRKDGSRLWVEISAAFNRDENGRPFEMVGVTREITERKKAEEALRLSERRYRVMTENVNDVIWTMDFGFRWTYVSPSVFRITGYRPEELINVSLKELITPKLYEAMKRGLEERLAGDTEEERPVTFEYQMTHKDGHMFWAEINASFNRDETGKPFEIVGITREISERKKAEEDLRESERRYRMIVENVHDSISVMDLNLNYLFISPSEVRLTGHEPEELMKIPLSDQMTPESYKLAKTILTEELERELGGDPGDPGRSRILELELHHKNGGTIWVEMTFSFNRDENGKPVAIISAARNISERKKAEEEKDKLERQLAQSQKMETIGRLAGGVAHDFNNMLSVILGYVDLAKRRLAKQHPVLKDISEIEKAAIRSRDITTQLLAFSRKQIIMPKIIDLNELVSNTQKALTRLIGEDIHLSYYPGENLWPIKFDPSQIEQILINLAVNARDAMPDGGRLTIETANSVLDDFYCERHIGFKPGSYVRLIVSDNGMGMDKQTMQYIFEPFFTTKEAGKGTGLGLATVYGIAKQNNGFINVYSEPGQGTTFSIYLPRTIEERDAGEESEEEPDLAATGNILLVEDDPMVLEIAKEMLKSFGYVVTVADNPLDAILLFEKNPSFDLVITDVIMPKMKGKELKERLMAIRQDVKVLFMSGYTANVIADHGVLEEGVQFLQKPFTIKDLKSKVTEVIGKG